jgi:hypothetical protein
MYIDMTATEMPLEGQEDLKEDNRDSIGLAMVLCIGGLLAAISLSAVVGNLQSRTTVPIQSAHGGIPSIQAAPAAPKK